MLDPAQLKSIERQVDIVGVYGLTDLRYVDTWSSTLEAHSRKSIELLNASNKLNEFFAVVGGISGFLAVIFIPAGFGGGGEWGGYILIFAVLTFLVCLLAKQLTESFVNTRNKDVNITKATERQKENASSRYRTITEDLGANNLIVVRKYTNDRRLKGTAVWIANNGLFLAQTNGEFAYEGTSSLEPIHKWTLKYEQINLSDIMYFTKSGDLFSYEEYVSGGGYKYSIGGAIIGGILAGDIGMLVGGIREDPIKTRTRTIDSRKSIIICRTNNVSRVIEFSLNYSPKAANWQNPRIAAGFMPKYDFT